MVSGRAGTNPKYHGANATAGGFRSERSTDAVDGYRESRMGRLTAGVQVSMGWSNSRAHR